MDLSSRTLLVHVAMLAACRGGELDGGSRLDANECDAGACSTPDSGAETAVVPEDPVWGCVGKVPPLPAIENGVPVHQRARFVNLLEGGRPLAGLQIKACAELDVQCAEPIAWAESDENGVVDVLLYSGFRGYLDVLPSTQMPDLVPALVYLPIPDKNAPATTSAIPSVTLMTKSDLNYFAGSVGKSVSPQDGHLLFGSLDCEQGPAANTIVRVEPIASETFSFYNDAAGEPNLTQGKTTALASGGHINLPPGSVSVVVTRGSGERIAIASVIIRAGTITYASFAPTP